MTHLLPFKIKIGPGPFSQICLLLSALWLIIIYPSINWFCPFYPLGTGKQNSHIDFFQYYAGAVVVRHGIWDALYPIPKPDVYDRPNHFIPKYKTFLFNPTVAGRDPAFYPEVNTSNASDCAPELKTYFPEINHYFYFYPPPAALLLWPLSFVSFNFAANCLWPTISMWSLFVASFFASRIHRLFRQTDSYTEGLIILACALFSYRGQTHINAGNITPILSALIAFSSYALIRRRLFAFSCAYVPLVLFKTIGLMWLPLLLINRAYWRTLIYLTIITLLLNGIVVELAGVGVYQKFFSLAHKMVVPHGIGIVPGIYYKFGFYPHALYLIIDLVCLGLLYYGYCGKSVKNLVKDPVNDSSLCLVALLAGTMALFCLTNFTCLLPYCPNYLFFPFLGWILQEGYLASGYWRYFILGGTVVAFLVLAAEWIISWCLSYFLGEESAGWFFYVVFQGFCILIIPAFFLLVALRRLLASRNPFQPAR